MKRIIATGLFLVTTFFLFGQKSDAFINAKEAERIVKYLSSDDLKGRRVFTPDIEKATDFIVNEFKSIGLQTLNNTGSYRQEFTMIRPKLINTTTVFDAATIDPKNIIVITCQPHLKIDQTSGYEGGSIKAGGSVTREGVKFIRASKNFIVMVDESYSSGFSRLNLLKRELFYSDKNVIFILGNSLPKNFSIESNHEIINEQASNIVGVLPGKTLENEMVIISGHYDHVGTGSPMEAFPHGVNDSIYNGANDNASGTAAVIMLAKYFKKIRNNERTLVFVAFTAEELGGFGSEYFSGLMNAEKVAAMINIEMIGTESKWGRNSAYLTGFEKTDLGTILQRNINGTGFAIYPDPYTQQQLFYRSDNASLARLGVPAHSLSTSKMDNELNYHKVSDQLETLDFENMAMIVRSIAISMGSIISGKETPIRVKTEELR